VGSNPIFPNIKSNKPPLCLVWQPMILIITHKNCSKWVMPVGVGWWYSQTTFICNLINWGHGKGAIFTLTKLGLPSKIWNWKEEFKVGSRTKNPVLKYTITFLGCPLKAKREVNRVGKSVEGIWPFSTAHGMRYSSLDVKHYQFQHFKKNPTLKDIKRIGLTQPILTR